MSRKTRDVLLAAFRGTVFLTVSVDNADAQTAGRSRLLPNPVPSAGGRVNIWDPNRGQGAGWFNAARNGGRTHNGSRPDGASWNSRPNRLTVV